jgi:hypothetical protein
MLAIRTAPALIGAFVCCCLMAAPAAAFNVNAFTLTPSTPSAGANPNIATHVALTPDAASPDGDDVRNLTVALAPGLLASLSAVPTKCTDGQLAVDACPAASQVGSGLVDSNTPFGLFVNVPAKLYLLEPAAGDAGRAGMVADAAPFGPKFMASGPVALRTSPDVGLNIKFEDIARTVMGAPIEVRRIDLTINGTVGGQTFTRNPTSCGVATSKLTAVSYGGITSTRQSAFTPTGCSSLPFAPQVTGSAKVGTFGDVEITTNITQAAGEAALKRSELTLPKEVAPRFAALSRICTLSDPAACPSSGTVGSATVESPLLGAALNGRVVLRKGSPIPGIALVFPAPFPFTFEGSVALTSLGLKATFDGLPDVPISKLQVKFSGGPNSLFTAGGLCFSPGSVRGSFTGHNGKTASDVSPTSVSGCPWPTPKASVSLRGLLSGVPKLSVVVSAPQGAIAARTAKPVGIGRISIKLPRGLKLNKRKLAKRIALRLDGKRGGVTRSASRKRLRLSLTRAEVKRVVLKLKGKALRVSPSLRRKLRLHPKRKLRFTIKVKYAGDGTFTLRPKARPKS